MIWRGLRLERYHKCALNPLLGHWHTVIKISQSEKLTEIVHQDKHLHLHLKRDGFFIYQSITYNLAVTTPFARTINAGMMSARCSINYLLTLAIVPATRTGHNRVCLHDPPSRDFVCNLNDANNLKCPFVRLPYGNVQTVMRNNAYLKRPGPRQFKPLCAPPFLGLGIDGDSPLSAFSQGCWRLMNFTRRLSLLRPDVPPLGVLFLIRFIDRPSCMSRPAFISQWLATSCFVSHRPGKIRVNY